MLPASGPIPFTLCQVSTDDVFKETLSQLKEIKCAIIL